MEAIYGTSDLLEIERMNLEADEAWKLQHPND